jgi:hypothetical protein
MVLALPESTVPQEDAFDASAWRKRDTDRQRLVLTYNGRVYTQDDGAHLCLNSEGRHAKQAENGRKSNKGAIHE